MCAQKTAPKKTVSVETLRNDAIDWLAFRLANGPEDVHKRLGKHVRGPLGSANEVSLRSFFRRTGDSELYLTFDSKGELKKFDEMLTESGIFENIDCVYTTREDGKLDVTVTMDQRELNLAQAKKLLNAKEEKLLGIARKEKKKEVKEFTKDMDDLAGIVEKAIESNDPMQGAEETELRSTPVRTEGPKKKLKVEKEPEVAPLPQSITDSEGDPVPLVPNKKVRKKLEKAIEDEEKFAFVVKGGSRMEKFLDESWLSRHGIDARRVDIEKKGKRSWKVTINGKMSSEEETRQRYESILRELQGERG